MLVSALDFQEALPAASWAAHMGDPILLTYRDHLPQATAQAIAGRQPDVYIVGSERSISSRVEEAVHNLTSGFVDRITGGDPFEIAVNFARYNSPTGQFGWNVNERHGWGKHTPLLLVHPRAVPEVVEQYILSINPRHEELKPPFMHGFVIGT